MCNIWQHFDLTLLAELNCWPWVNYGNLWRAKPLASSSMDCPTFSWAKAVKFKGGPGRLSSTRPSTELQFPPPGSPLFFPPRRVPSMALCSQSSVLSRRGACWARAPWIIHVAAVAEAGAPHVPRQSKHHISSGLWHQEPMATWNTLGKK